VSEQPKLNAVGKPYGTFDPNYKLRSELTKIGRLRKPYGRGFFRNDPTSDEKHGRRQRLQPAPLLDLLNDQLKENGNGNLEN
jgi:hypothetical protein